MWNNTIKNLEKLIKNEFSELLINQKYVQNCIN